MDNSCGVNAQLLRTIEQLLNTFLVSI